MNNTCRVCQSSDLHFLFTINNSRFVRCCTCTHVFLDSTYDAAAIKKLYERYGDAKGKTYFQGINADVLNTIDTYLRSCREYCRTGSSPLRLLDIGCGTGALLSRAKKLGFATEGIEICDPLANDAARNAGCPVHNTLLAQVALPENSFDSIIMYDLIEHLQDPLGDMNSIYRLLKKGGILFILTPNDNALLRAISRVLYRASLHCFSKPMERLYYPDHLSYFTRKSISAFLNRCGFEIVLLETRNQELSRLELPGISRWGVRAVFHLSEYFRDLGGKLVVYAIKI
jgi:2-polyprenyl-3-methyl-5-hydroxy-6-metoxy-1,4-benzoquinol methylase